MEMNNIWSDSQNLVFLPNTSKYMVGRTGGFYQQTCKFRRLCSMITAHTYYPVHHVSEQRWCRRPITSCTLQLFGALTHLDGRSTLRMPRQSCLLSWTHCSHVGDLRPRTFETTCSRRFTPALSASFKPFFSLSWL